MLVLGVTVALEAKVMMPEPKALELPKVIWPAFKVVPPEYLLFPERIVVPDPFWMKAPPPARMPVIEEVP